MSPFDSSFSFPFYHCLRLLFFSFSPDFTPFLPDVFSLNSIPVPFTHLLSSAQYLSFFLRSPSTTSSFFLSSSRFFRLHTLCLQNFSCRSHVASPHSRLTAAAVRFHVSAPSFISSSLHAFPLTFFFHPSTFFRHRPTDRIHLLSSISSSHTLPCCYVAFLLSLRDSFFVFRFDRLLFFPASSSSSFCSSSRSSSPLFSFLFLLRCPAVPFMLSFFAA